MSVKRPPGRPPLADGDPSAQLSVKLPSRQFAEVCERAQRERLSLAEWIRRQLTTEPAEKRNLK